MVRKLIRNIFLRGNVFVCFFKKEKESKRVMEKGYKYHNLFSVLSDVSVKNVSVVAVGKHRLHKN